MYRSIIFNEIIDVEIMINLLTLIDAIVAIIQTTIKMIKYYEFPKYSIHMKYKL